MFSSLRSAFFAWLGTVMLCLVPPAAAAAAAPAETQIDVMILFEKRATAKFEKAGANLENVANQAIGKLNDILANTIGPDGKPLKTHVEFNLAHYACLQYEGKTQEGGRSGRKEDFDYFESDDTIKKWRDEHKADLVVIFNGYDINNGGIMGGALAIGGRQILRPQGECSHIDNAFYIAQFQWECGLPQGDLTFQHEVCHLLVCGHSDMQFAQSGPQLQPDSRGSMVYGENDVPLMSTLMTYETMGSEHNGHLTYALADATYTYTPTADNGLSCRMNGKPIRPLPYLSGPYVMHDNETGKDYSMGDNKHNNARNLLYFAPIVASYRVNGKEKAPGDTFAEAQGMSRPLQSMEPALFFWRFEKRQMLHQILNGKWENTGDDSEEKNAKTAAAILQLIAFSNINNFAQIPNPDPFPIENLTKETLEKDFASIKTGGNEEPWYWLWGCNRTAGRENGEPIVHEQAAGKTVWYRFSPTQDGVAHYKARKGFSNAEVMAKAFTGNAVNNLTPAEEQHFTAEPQLSAEEKEHFSCTGSFYVRRGQDVYLAVDTREQEGGFFNLIFYVEEKELPPLPAVALQQARPSLLQHRWLLLALGLISLGCAGGMVIALIKLRRLNRALRAAVDKGGVRIDGRLSDGSSFSCYLTMAQLAAKHNYTIGSAQKCLLVIPDPTVEARHAVFKVRNGQLLLGDAGSRDGTVVNGRLLRKDECVRVSADCECRLGGVILQLHPAPAAQPQQGKTPPDQRVAPNNQDNIPAAAMHGSIRLSCVTGNGKKLEFVISTAAIATVHNYTIGRAADNHLVIADPTVSGHHAVLKMRQGRLLMGDAGSSSGTEIDGISLQKDDCVVVRQNTAGRMGAVTFSIHIN